MDNEDIIKFITSIKQQIHRIHTEEKTNKIRGRGKTIRIVDRLTDTDEDLIKNWRRWCSF